MHVSRTRSSSAGLTTYTLLKRCHLYPCNWFRRVICWVITWCWCDFLRGHKTGLKSAQRGIWQLLLCPAGLHFITTAAVSHGVFVHSRRTTQRLLERPVIRCYETPENCLNSEWRSPSSVLWLACNVKLIQLRIQWRSITPPNQYLYLQHFPLSQSTPKKVKKKHWNRFWIYLFFLLSEIEAPLFI